MNTTGAAQKKFFITIAAMLIGLCASGFFIYLPRTAAIVRLKAELRTLEKRIQSFERMGGEIKLGMEQNLLKYDSSLPGSKFPAREAQSVQMLSEYARKQKMDIVSLKIQPKVVYLDGRQLSVRLNRTCYALPVAMEITGHYENLVKYLELVKTYLPAYVTIEKLTIKTEEPQPGPLKIQLEINVYLLS